jgi:phage shock protein A
MRLRERIRLLLRAGLGRPRRDEDRTEDALRRADKMAALLEQLEARLHRALARQAGLESQLRQAKEMAGQWDRRADDALRAGDETTARDAIRHKLAYTQVADQLQSSLARQATATAELQADLTKLQSRLARARKKARPASTLAPSITSSRPPQPSTEEAAHPVASGTDAPSAPGEEEVHSLAVLRERMSRIWSDAEIENELEAIKSRLSAGHSTDGET